MGEHFFEVVVDGFFAGPDHGRIKGSGGDYRGFDVDARLTEIRAPTLALAAQDDMLGFGD